MKPFLWLCITLLPIVSVIEAVVPSERSDRSYEIYDDNVVGDFPIIGIFNHNSFVINNADPSVFVVEEPSQNKTKDWQLEDDIRQSVLENSSLYAFENMRTGDVVKANAIPLSRYTYDKKMVGTLKIGENRGGVLFLADYSYYTILNYDQANGHDWKHSDVVLLKQKNASKNLYFLHNLTSGSKALAIRSPLY